MTRKLALFKAVLAGSAMFIGALAQADVAQFKGFQGWHYVTTSESSVVLDNVGNTVATFTGSGKFTIQYTASCVVWANNWAHMDIDVYVDGFELAAIYPDSDAFCSKADNYEYYAGNALQVRTYNLGTGTHTVQIKARINGSSGSYGYLAFSGLNILK